MTTEIDRQYAHAVAAGFPARIDAPVLPSESRFRLDGVNGATRGDKTLSDT